MECKSFFLLVIPFMIPFCRFLVQPPVVICPRSLGFTSFNSPGKTVRPTVSVTNQGVVVKAGDRLHRGKTQAPVAGVGALAFLTRRSTSA